MPDFMLKTLLILIFVIISTTLNAQQFKNLKAIRKADLVIISYDFSTEKPEQAFDIKLECSADGGKTFNISPQFVSGDLQGITSGTGKSIVWNTSSEQHDFSGMQLVFQLVAIVNEPLIPDQTNSGTFIDSRDGHEYRWIKIGTQIWMLENLAYLPQVSPSKEGSPSKPVYYVYGYNGTNISDAKSSANFQTYGVLYNWEAAKNSCPEGWHLPSDNEWKQLETELGMSQKQANTIGSRGAEAGKTIKAAGGWNKSGNGINESGFSALPGGGRYGDLSFGNIGSNGFWWSSSEGESAFAWGRGLGSSSSEIYYGANYKENGYSVRCVRDF
jgi:uncharacterized protein (TIGR02145 family)